MSDGWAPGTHEEAGGGTGDGFDALAPALQYHIVNSLGWNGLRPLQDIAARTLTTGDDALLLAPTAGGKTEAAILPLLTRMTKEDWRGTSVLYICPLRALLNNLQPRISSYTAWLGRRCEVRHGDTSTAARRRLAVERPDILLTTPESLEAMLVSTVTDPRLLFADLRAVVVDEIHAFVGDDRGWHLQGVLSRIERLAGRRLQRVGLSATVGNPEALLEWLRAGRPGNARVLKPGSNTGNAGSADNSHTGNAEEAEICLDYVGGLDNAATVIAGLHQGEKRLVFADSRRSVEILAHGLHLKGVTTFVSHSSLAASERRRAERAFSESRDCVITATSTLELGVDVGDLDRCLQIGAPRTVASFLQRLGRTGRRSAASRNMLFLETNDDDLLMAAGLLLLWADGYVEPIVPPAMPYHVAAQQILGLVLQERGISEDEWRGWFDGFSPLTQQDWTDIADHMKEHGFLGVDGNILFAGPQAERRYGGIHYRDIMAVFTADPQLAVLHGREEIGFLDPVTLRTRVEGPRTITLAGRGWVVRSVDWGRRRVHVEPSDVGGSMRWSASARPLSSALAGAVRRVLLGEDPAGVRLTGRAVSRLKQLREKYEERVSPHEPDVLIRESGGNARWWTFAGGRRNAAIVGALSRTAPELLPVAVQWDDFSISLAPDAPVSQARSALALAMRRRETVPDIMDPIIDARALRAVKFGEMVPESMLRREIASM